MSEVAGMKAVIGVKFDSADQKQMAVDIIQIHNLDYPSAANVVASVKKVSPKKIKEVTLNDLETKYGMKKLDWSKK